MTQLADLYNQIHEHEKAIKQLKGRIEEFRNNCEHLWTLEEGYFYSGLYCRKCGSTK